MRILKLTRSTERLLLEARRAHDAEAQRIAHRIVTDVRRQGDSFHVAAAGKQYQFPASDVVQLPIRNTTAELIAGWISAQVEERLKARPEQETINRAFAELLENVKLQKCRVNQGYLRALGMKADLVLVSPEGPPK